MIDLFIYTTLVAIGYFLGAYAFEIQSRKTLDQLQKTWTERNKAIEQEYARLDKLFDEADALKQNIIAAQQSKDEAIEVLHDNIRLYADEILHNLTECKKLIDRAEEWAKGIKIFFELAQPDQPTTNTTADNCEVHETNE